MNMNSGRRFGMFRTLLLKTRGRSPLIMIALLSAVALQTLHFYFYYDQPAGRAMTWATVDWIAWFLAIGLLHAAYRQWTPGDRWRVPSVVAIVLLAGLAQVVLSTWSLSLIYPPSRPFWADVLHLIDKRWLQGLLYALVLWGFFSLLWPALASNEASRRPEQPDAAGRLRVDDGKAVHWLEPAEIRSLQSARNYVCLSLADRQLIVREPLTSLVERLPRDRFVRIGRSCVVQRDKILRIEPYSRYSKQVVLDNGAALRIGRTYLAAAEAALGLR